MKFFAFWKKVSPVKHSAGPLRQEISQPPPSLQKAFSDGSVDAVRELLNKGADINSRGGRGQTLLHSAVSNGYPDVVRLLIDRGADVNARDDEARTPLFEAMQREYGKRYTDVVKLLLEAGAHVNVRDRHDRNTPLHLAAIDGNVAVVRLLVEKGANVNAGNHEGKTPYDWAISGGSSDCPWRHEGHKEVIALLEARGAG
jgi:ankyrin repeat protein